MRRSGLISPGLVLVVVLVGVFTALAGVAILELRDRADMARQAQLEFALLLATSKDLAARGWEAQT